MDKHVFVDDREDAAELCSCLETEHGLIPYEKRLHLGDYFIPPDTLIERKTITDFCRSLASGRLFRQTYALMNYTDNPILLIEGSSFHPNETGIALEAVKGTLITLAQTFRLPVLRTRDQKDSAWYLNRLLLQRRRIGENRGTLQGYCPKKLDIRKRYVLESLPGVGAKLATALLEYFGTVENVAQATKEQLSDVPGVGPNKAEDIDRVLREDPPVYRTTNS